jgi:hypothetical protein
VDARLELVGEDTLSASVILWQLHLVSRLTFNSAGTTYLEPERPAR